MSKKRRRQVTVQLPQTQPDARREIAARASKALRSAEVSKLRNTLIQAYNQEVMHEQVRTHPHRAVARQGLQTANSQRRMPDITQLRRARMRPEVRNFLQDGVRTLACESRRARKETLFAMRRTGKAGRGNKKARWTEKSYMRCK